MQNVLFKIKYEYAGCVTDMRTGKEIFLYTTKISEKHCRIVTYQMAKARNEEGSFAFDLDHIRILYRKLEVAVNPWRDTIIKSAKDSCIGLKADGAPFPYAEIRDLG